MARAHTRFGRLTIGPAPLVVGSISSAATLAQLAANVGGVCDIVEVRADLVNSEVTQWLDHAQAIEAQNVPVIVTIRLANEGGRWTKPDADRLPLFKAALEHVSAADIELSSPLLLEVSALARHHQRALIVSCHDFDRTPSDRELREVVQKAAGVGSVVKIATLTRTDQDLAALRGLLAEPGATPLCVLGMGPLGPRTRLEFPGLGSCLTYGYVDASVAPGQVSARELMQQLHGS